MTGTMLIRCDRCTGHYLPPVPRRGLDQIRTDAAQDGWICGAIDRDRDRYSPWPATRDLCPNCWHLAHLGDNIPRFPGCPDCAPWYQTTLWAVCYD